MVEICLVSRRPEDLGREVPVRLILLDLGQEWVAMELLAEELNVFCLFWLGVSLLAWFNNFN